MKTKIILVLFFVLSFLLLKSQTPIDVAESTLKVGTMGEEVFYYGFAEGDQLIFNFEEVNGKELKEVEILELPSSSKFMDYKTKKIENKTLTVNRTGIYKFRLSNSALSGRVCKYKIQRIPASDETKNFNTSVFWKTVHDTTYSDVQEKYLIKTDTLYSDFYNSTPQISSQNAVNGNYNYIVVDFPIPDNTVSWSFYICTGSEGKKELERAKKEFMDKATSIASKIPGYGPMAALALTGVSYINKVQGEDNVKYWFIPDANNVNAFKSGLEFKTFKSGDVINEASQMKNPLKGKVYLALKNDNTFEPITVSIIATAVIVNEQWGTRTVKKMNVNSYNVPYLK
ncbi:MAG TPA: hypothetical protein DEA97_21445 [Bacteroidales bacterium]|nr:MAG: hypothetical protein UR43_C0014G0018 [candidate division TM6 bacterium GW2011_GWF2_33_332]HBS89126.1 hypothetical protein [Bacteroidales bacterium]